MSVLFVTYSEHYVILCADKQVTHVKSGKAEKQQVTKLEKWAPDLAVGFCGNMKLATIISSAVRTLFEAGEVSDHCVENVAELFEAGYDAARAEYPEMPQDLVVKFAIAGQTQDGKFGVSEVFMDADGPQTTLHPCKNAPMTMVFEPEDVPAEVCNQLLDKAFLTSKNSNMSFMDMMAQAHQKAVRFVSLRSKFVGAKSDVVILTRG